MKIAFIGFGEAARAFRESLAARDPALTFCAYDILLEKEEPGAAIAAAIGSANVTVSRSPAEAVTGADWIFSAVTADQSLAAVEAVAPYLRSGQVLFDINSVSPQRKKDSAARLAATGCAYVDMAVMAPVHPKGHRTPVLLAGSVSPATASRLTELGFAFETVGPEAGAATAIKMVRSLFVKGLEAITVEALLAAQASGCYDYILKSLSGSYPGLNFPELAPYQFERTLKHGRRRAAEMRESAKTLDDLGLHGRLADAVADVQDMMGNVAASPQDGLRETIAAALRARKG